jgi:hypothetical protein
VRLPLARARASRRLVELGAEGKGEMTDPGGATEKYWLVVSYCRVWLSRRNLMTL